jgi:pimeloyl-ACP methyl ester carboxylesterase
VTNRPVLAYDDRGEGPVLFFVHGFLNEAAVWGGVIDELEADFRCIAVDLPGHGRSSGSGPGTYTRDLVLGDICTVMDQADCGPAVMVGHSLGGYLSLALAIEDPERVRGLGLVGAGPGFRNPASREKWNDSVRTLVAERDLPDGMEAISMHVDALVMDRMSEIDVPTTVIVGERDKAFMASADVFEKQLNVLTRTVVPGAGHMVHAKAAAAVAGALRDAFSG